MAEAIENLQKQCDNLQRENEILKKEVGFEFEKIQKAFQQMGNLLDLLYLETSVQIEILVKKGIFTQEEFTKLLEETAKKVQDEIKKSEEQATAAEKSSIITKL